MADKSILSRFRTDMGLRCYDPDGRDGRPRTRLLKPRVIDKIGITVAPRAETEHVNGRASLFRFVEATADKIFFFRKGDYYTEKMRQHPAVKKTRADITEYLSSECKLSCEPVASGKVHYSIGDKSSIGKAWQYVKDVFGFGTNGKIGSDPDYGVVGSFSTRSNWKSSGIDCERGIASIDFSVSNNMGAESGGRISYGPEREKNSLFENDPNSPSGRFGTVYQNWDWNEEVQFEGNPFCKQLD
jgi:hypothetical protein